MQGIRAFRHVSCPLIAVNFIFRDGGGGGWGGEGRGMQLGKVRQFFEICMCGMLYVNFIY